MKIHILGTASAPLPRRSMRGGIGILVSFSETRVVFDCGPGVPQKIINSGTDLWNVDYLFISHHHYDHTSDLGLLVMGRWEWALFNTMIGGTLAPQLEIYGPTRTQKMVNLLFGNNGFFQNDILSRIKGEGEKLYAAHGVKIPIEPPMPISKDIEPGYVLQKDDFKVTAAEGQHCQPYLMPLAYRIDTQDGSVVFSGDTGECRRITELAQGADLLIHDCSQTEDRRVSIGYQKLHSSPVTVGRTAADAGVKKVVALHFGLKSEPPDILESFEEQIRQHFRGDVIIANDLTEIEI